MNRILVEGKDDKAFFEYLCKDKEVKIQQINGKDNLAYALKDLKLSTISKLGIVLDADNDGIDNRKRYIDEVLKTIAIGNVKVIPFIIQVDGAGNLETLLIKILKSETSKKAAECLEKWKNCYNKLSLSEFNKLYLQVLIRYDICTKQEQNHYSKNCQLEKILQKEIFDFNHSALDEVKQFLSNF